MPACGTFSLPHECVLWFHVASSASTFECCEDRISCMCVIFLFIKSFFVVCDICSSVSSSNQRWGLRVSHTSLVSSGLCVPYCKSIIFGRILNEWPLISPQGQKSDTVSCSVRSVETSLYVYAHTNTHNLGVWYAYTVKTSEFASGKKMHLFHMEIWTTSTMFFIETRYAHTRQDFGGHTVRPMFLLVEMSLKTYTHGYSYVFFVIEESYAQRVSQFLFWACVFKSFMSFTCYEMHAYPHVDRFTHFV